MTRAVLCYNTLDIIGHFEISILSLKVRQRGQKQYKQVAMDVKDISISSTFLCLCPLNLSFELNSNISKVAYDKDLRKKLQVFHNKINIPCCILV